MTGTRLAERLTATLDSITDAFLTMDLDWRFTFMNDLEKPFTAAAFLGRVREALGERGAA